MSAAAVLRSVRMVGRFGWLGGYHHAVVLSDGELLCAWCVAPNYRQISTSTRANESDEWRAIAVIALDGADSAEYCAHCNRLLQGAEPCEHGNPEDSCDDCAREAAADEAADAQRARDQDDLADAHADIATDSDGWEDVLGS